MHKKTLGLGLAVTLAATVAACGGSQAGDDPDGGLGTVDGGPRADAGECQATDRVFFDDFDYPAGREDPGVVAIFQAHGWTWAKTQQAPETGNPRGYLYTTDSLPNYSGPLPGGGTRVLAMEALPTTLGNPNGEWGDMQTTHHLLYGSVEQSTDTIPANVWLQFWLYLDGSPGGFDGQKFLYACNTDYPCQQFHWMGLLRPTSAEPFWYDIFPDGHVDTDQMLYNEMPVPSEWHVLQAPEAYYSVQSFNWGGGDDLGHTDTSEYLLGQRWTLVKLHIDTSGPQGRYEAWMRPMGGAWVKTAEWIGGQTPDFTWDITNPSGHRQLAIPTTVGGVRALRYYPTSYDSIIFMDDFAITRSEGCLPTYP